MLQVVDKAREVLASLEEEIYSAETSIKKINKGLENRGRDEFGGTPRQSQQNPSKGLQSSLPKAELVKFNGNPKDWPAFWTTFKYVIDNSDADDVFTLIYLKGLLVGPAFDLIKDYTPTAVNYPIVLKVLQRKYGDYSMIKWKLRQELYELPVTKDYEDPKPTLDRLLDILRKLDGINAPIALDEFDSIISTKLPLARLNKAKELKLCETCLRKGHTKEVCRTSMRPCFYCKDRSHISSLCPVQFERLTNQQTKWDAKARKGKNQKVAEAPDNRVKNSDNPDLTEETGLFFDQGSEWSYIDEDLAKGMKLRIANSATTSLMTFNADNPKRIKTASTRIAILTSKGQEIIEVRTIEAWERLQQTYDASKCSDLLQKG
uniref:CCHC-type domain-containing protein n=1 Tax=Syphacia muris TaxID=451379 RepID=A0A0N5B1H9_9BILA